MGYQVTKQVSENKTKQIDDIFDDDGNRGQSRVTAWIES